MSIKQILFKILKKKKPQGDSSEKQYLINEIKSVRSELNLLKNNYNIASGELVDYYINQINANELKYKYLVDKLKKYDTA